MMIKRVFLLLFAMLMFSELSAQVFPTHRNDFGKNRIQHRSFEWQYVSSNNFEIYFNEGQRELAKLTSQMAEEEFRRITDFTGFFPYSKIKIFVYRSVSDLQQSNIGVNEQDFSIGGQTNFAKSVVELAYTGSRISFRKELSREIADAVLFEMMYGGNLKEVLRSSYLLSLPDWYIAGASAYIAEGWSEEMDNFVRANISKKDFLKPENYSDENARLAGQSIWNYIVSEYGKTVVGNILNLTRIVRSERTGVKNTLGMEYPVFLEQWKNFYAGQIREVQGEYKKPNIDALLSRIPKRFDVREPALSPDGTKLAYAAEQRGRWHIFVRDLETGKEKKLYKGGIYVINQKVNPNIPLLDWKNNETLYAIGTEKGKLSVFKLPLDDKESILPVQKVQNIHSFSISPGGQSLVISAELNGQTDIYTLDPGSGKVNALTNDPYDDLDPKFIGNNIVFASDRPNEGLKPEKGTPYAPPGLGLNLFLFKRSERELSRLTNDTYFNYKPVVISENEILFLSNQRGIRQLFYMNIEKQIITQSTNFLFGAEDFEYGNDKLLIQFRDGALKNFYLFNGIDVRENTFTQKTPRRKLMDLRAFRKRRKEKNEALPGISDMESTKDTAPEDKEETPKEETLESDDYKFDTFETKNKEKEKAKDYEYFSGEASETKENIQETKLSALKNYESRFSVENALVSFAFDPLRDFGLVLEAGMTDALENHKFNAGVFNLGLFTLENGILFAEYQYLRQRIDYSFRYDRHALTLLTPFFTHKYSLNRFMATASYPLNVTTRVSLSPFYTGTRFIATSDFDPAIQQFPGSSAGYGGLRADFVFDNTIETGPNTRTGTRFKAFAEQFLSIAGGAGNFGQLMFDARHYREVFNAVTLAGRVAYGQFYGGGAASKVYRLGGVDNWIISRDVESTEKNDPFFMDENDPDAYRKDLTDILFMQYAMPMRGFNYNKLNGNNFVLMNLEVRIPVAQAFYRQALKSKFVRNLQFVTFFDAGSSWTGISPFNRENALNTIEIGGSNSNSPFYARVSNFKDPFLVGYGFGVRTKVLNYFTKFDVAWGVEDDVITPVQYYFSLGYDF